MLKTILDQAYIENNNKNFIINDPISIPHRFTKKEDIETSAFLTSILSFGKRSVIISKANDLMNRMENEPYYYIKHNHTYEEIDGFKHRTINDEDIKYYMKSLKMLYSRGGLEKFFSEDIEKSLIDFRKIFFSLRHEKRAERHISDITSGSAAKRLNMFLRWMVRSDNIDFGIWHMNRSKLYIPLDIHVGNVSRELGLLTRKNNDWKSVKEITHILRKIDNDDPIKYDISLFSLGINK